MSDIAIKIVNLKKEYKLGTIGGKTLNEELQSWWARKRGKEDPNLKICQDNSNVGESFYALNGIDLEIKKIRDMTSRAFQKGIYITPAPLTPIPKR